MGVCALFFIGCSNSTEKTSDTDTSSVLMSDTTAIVSDTDTTSVTVTVNAMPVASVSGNATICSGQSTTLTANGGGTYIWQPGGQTTTSIVVTSTAAATYSVIVSKGNCLDTASISLVVNPNPTANAASNVTILQGQSTTLAASGGATYIWSNGTAGYLISVSPLVTTLYCVTVSDTNGCTDTACVTVTIETIDCSAA